MPDHFAMPKLDVTERPSVADQVFEELRRQVLSLELTPGTKISEVEIAKAMGVSRQPVRDAFYRLSKLGFILIRPQRATTVTPISQTSVMQARFIRTALEAETVRVATTALTDADLDALGEILEGQRIAVETKDGLGFHRLDEAFHYQICARAGLAFTWDLIVETKWHMDRVRMLTLASDTAAAYEDHVRIFEALRSRVPEQAEQTMRDHLSRIVKQLERIRGENNAWFAED